MKITNLSQLESEALLKDRMDAVKGGGDPSRYDFCLSCICPITKSDLSKDTNLAAEEYVPGPEPD